MMNDDERQAYEQAIAAVQAADGTIEPGRLFLHVASSWGQTWSTSTTINTASVLTWSDQVVNGQITLRELPLGNLTASQGRTFGDMLYLRNEYRVHQERRRRQRRPQRRALQLLRSLLTDAQAEQLRRVRHVTVEAASGRRYRILPNTGVTQLVERHGRLDYAIARYCLHDPNSELPPADVAVAHLLWIQADEANFRETANETPTSTVVNHGRPNAGWDGTWRRRLNEARRERAAA